MDDGPTVELPAAPREAPVIVERRRPGRIEHRNAALIALLRQPPPDSVDDESLEAANADLISARGILIGLLLATPMWGVIGLTIWLLMGR
jgi:hypothetical protein